MNKISVQKNMLFNTAGSIIYYFSIWLLTILMVKISGFEEAGILSLAMSVTASPAIIGLFNIRSYQVSDLYGEYSNKTYITSRIVTNLLSFLLCLVIVIISGYSIYKSVVIMMFMLYKMTEGTADVYYGIEQRNGRLDYTGISLMIRGIGGVFCFCLFYIISDNLVIGILSMIIVSLLIVEVYDRRKVSEGNEKVELRKINSLLVTCFPLAVAAFLNNLSIVIPKLYLEKSFGDEIMGIYSSVSSPTIVIQLAAATLFAPLVTFLTEKIKEGNKSDFLNILKKFFLMVILLSAICMIASKFLAGPVLILLFGKKIVPHIYLFLPVIVLSILIGINNCMLSICTLMREIKSQYLVGIAGIITTYVLSEIFVKRYSMTGVIIATVGTMIVQILIQIIIVNKSIRSLEN